MAAHLNSNKDVEERVKNHSPVIHFCPLPTTPIRGRRGRTKKYLGVEDEITPPPSHTSPPTKKYSPPKREGGKRYDRRGGAPPICRWDLSGK